MRIPVFYIPKTKLKKFLHIEKSYVPGNVIIPIGCDCHPAYSLQKLHLRKESFPFDWLNTDPLQGIQYVNDNIDTRFGHFLEGLKINERGHAVSSRYEYAEFIHEKDIIESDAEKTKLARRGVRFLNSLENFQINFLYNFPVSEIKSRDDIRTFTDTVTAFLDRIKENDTLHIYLRFDEGFDENAPLSGELFSRLKENKKLQVTRYTRELGRYGIWGNPKKYPELFRSLDISIKMTFPKIYIK